MSLALSRQDRCGAGAPCVLCCRRSRVCPAPHPDGFEPLLLLLRKASPITKKLPLLEALNSNWRRRRDSNPRDLIQAKRFSRPPHSTTLPPLRVG